MAAPLWQILNLPDNEKLVKVVASNIPKSPLAEMLAKECLN
jgi:hypothetical protein